MKALILAAGIGSRLRPITNYKPKTLVEVNGKPMLGYLIENLIENEINDIIICIGYKGDLIREFCINNYPNTRFYFIDNKDYLETNNMYSLYLAREYLDDDTILMNADLVYESNIIRGLLKTNGTHVAVDKGTYDEESMKIIVNSSGNIVDISKIIKQDQAFGRSIDVYKIIKADITVLKEGLIKIIEIEKNLNQWTEVLLQKLFRETLISAQPFEIGESKWIEIDNYDDLYKGEILFNRNLSKLKSKKVFLLDKDGTLMLGNNIIEGANELIELLNEREKKYYLFSNNSSKTIQENLEKFKQVGLNGFNEANFILSTNIAIHYLQSKDIKRLYVLANKNVINYLEKNGFEIDEKNPQALLLTYDTEINYEKITIFHNLVQKGIPYYATHIDYVCPTTEGNIPDIGSFIKLFETSTGKYPSVIFGKPSSYVINFIKNKMQIDEKDIVIIGDSVYTDIETKKYAPDIFTILVLTGESNRGDVENSDIKPDLVIKNLKELAGYL